MSRKLHNTWCSSTACRWEFKVNTFANSKVANASQCPCVHVCSQRVWECKSKNAVTLKQPPLDTVATIQLSLWWEDENKEKSDDKYKLRARLYRISCFLNTVIYLFICLFSGDSNQTDGVTWFRLGRLSCLPRREGSASWTSCLLGLPQA